MKTKTQAVPFHGGRYCYACEEKPVGLRDRRPEGGGMELACARHADPTIRIFAACIYCTGNVSKKGLDIDGNFAHAKCHREVSDGTYHGGL